MDQTTKPHKTFSTWTVVRSPNPAFDFLNGLHSAIFDPPDDEAFEEPDPPQVASPTVNPEPAESFPSLPNDRTPTCRKERAKAAARARYRQKRSDASKGSHSLSKKILERFPEDGPSVGLPKMSLDESPVASTGYVGLNGHKRSRRVYSLEEATGKGSVLGFTLQKWDGRKPTLIVDKNNIVCAILAGHPNDDDWPVVQKEAENALETRRPRCSIPPERLDHRRGAFVALQCGVSHGGGQMQPMNLKNEKSNQEVIDELNGMGCFIRVASFASAVMMRRAPKLYDHYAKNLTDLHGKDSRLKRPFKSSVFSACTYNFGPETVCYVHTDPGNLAYGMCSVTPLGSFDHTRGGHLILWDCHLVIEFPPGSTILFPSAVIAHSNCSIGPNETRYSFAQYTAGALFRWANNDFKTAVKFRKSLSKTQLEEEQRKDKIRWEEGLLLLPRVTNKNAIESIINWDVDDQ